MAIAVIGGLITSTLLSLLVVPVVFTFIDDIERGLGRLVRRMRHKSPVAAEPCSGSNGGSRNTVSSQPPLIKL